MPMLLVLIHSERCCFWYQEVPGINSECVVTQGQNVVLGCEVVVPCDGNNNTVGAVRWYRSIDLDTSVDITNVYVIQEGYGSYSEPFSSGRFTGLFRHTYRLVIHNISSSDGGYYWCQITINGTCSSPSPYVNHSVSTMPIDEGIQCPLLDYGGNPVCATKPCEEMTVYSHISSSSLIELTTVSYEVLRSSTTLLTATSSLPLPILSNPTSSALIGSLSSIIALLVFTLLLTIIVFVVAWKRREKRVQVQCETCRSKVVYLSMFGIGACNN